MTATVTPKPGALSGEKLTWETGSSIVASFSNLIVDMTTEHSIPSDGKIIIDFPKWNSFGISSSLYAS